MDFKELELEFWKTKKHQNLGFDSNSSPRTHKRLIYTGFKCVSKQSSEK
jgi:hypothetical protein